MRQRPAGSSEDQDALTPRASSAVPVHGDRDSERPTGIARDTHDSAPSREPARDDALEQHPPQSHRTHRTPAPIDKAFPHDRPGDVSSMTSPTKDITPDSMVEGHSKRRQQLRRPWACSLWTVVASLLGFAALAVMVHSFMTRQLDTKGCEMCYMRPIYVPMRDFDTEHTRFASKYSLHLYREGPVDQDPRVKGVPVLFIPGNAGSYRQARALGAEAAYHYHDTLRHDVGAANAGKRPLDVFTVDFNEDITAFHGQTLLDQAEYVNDAITYILSLYHTEGRAYRSDGLPDPTSVIIVGHSMGGVVARTMVTMPNYQHNSINTIITLSAPHARAPVSFDGDIVRTYRGVNDYWRQAYSQKWANDNPLWHLTLISIAGGGLDTVVPSDYSSIASLVPETHGFTVFTASMPNVWTGTDHLSITWCDQVRKSVVRALYDVTDVTRPSQTVPRAERMRSFKKQFLTGLEDTAEKTLPHTESKTLLTMGSGHDSVVSQEERMVLRSLGPTKPKAKPYLLSIPSQGTGGKRFTLLTSERLDAPGEHGKLEVLFCSTLPLHTGPSLLSMKMDHMDLSSDGPDSTKYVCKNAAPDAICLPASTRHSTFPFKTDQAPFSYLQYDLEDLAEHHFVAIIDKSADRSAGWVIAEFSDKSDSVHRVDMGLQRLLATGLNLRLPAHRPLVTDIKVPAMDSSLLAYTLHIGKQSCDMGELFAPLLRQYVTDVYESKFFVNVKDANINLYGVAPYMPPPFLAKQPSNGLSLQIWSDPTCDSSVDVSLKVDLLGSVGKLWMRYRIVFAAFPLLIVALVLRQQFKTYDETGVFMSFSESMNQCLRSSIPSALVALTFLSIALAAAQQQTSRSNHHWLHNGQGSNFTKMLDYTDHELLLGSGDTFFWFLVPLFGLMCIGICVAINYVILGITYLLTFIYGTLPSASLRKEDARRSPATFGVTSTQQRVITTCILLSLVSTVIPYHFAYVVLCIVQLGTCVRGLKLARGFPLDTNYNFYNYAHSILILMLWILPINLPVLVVWVRNLAVHWLTPFSSHHNILSIMPFILLVETQSTGRMVPRIQSRCRILTNVLLFSIAAYAAVYGVSYAYVLHYLANFLCAWLVALHFDASALPQRIGTILETIDPNGNAKKKP